MFENVNKELANVSDWCFANWLSVNTSKTKYIFFINKHTPNIPLKLPDLKFNNIILKIVTKLKFLGVIIDENLNLQSHIKLIESKISKNIGVLFKDYAWIHLNMKCLSTVYFSFIHLYTDYGNIASTNKSQTKLY